ncbi:MAG TPA: ATP-binding protein [Verrucomicrobiae bacterium]
MSPALEQRSSNMTVRATGLSSTARYNGSASVWLEAGHVVVDHLGKVVHLGDSMARWLGLKQFTPGQSLEQTLAPRFPILPLVFHEILQSESGGAVELRSSDSESAAWVQCEVVPGPACQFLRFASILPPLSELSEGAWDQHLQSDAAVREMFLRSVRTEAQLGSITQRWPGVIFSQSADYGFSFASQRIEELTGYTLEQLRHRPGLFWQMVHEADADDLQTQWSKLDRQNSSISVSYRLRHATTGRVAYIMDQREAIFSENGLLLGFEGVWLDVTRQTIAERRLSSAAWKETIAVLTMGLAHDFSNIMAGIHSLSEAFTAELDSSHPHHEGLALIRQNAMQASHLVRRILSLHNDKVGELNYYNLNEVVADTVELMRKTVPRRIDIRTVLHAEGLPLFVDAVELRQVAINLMVNAMDAMPLGGMLEVSTSLHENVDAAGLVIGHVGRSPVICLTVKDTGCGIPQSKLGSIFDPFFTTKAVNKGSGLGLYNARLFVEKHHGAISVDSHLGAGATFKVWLPQADFTENDRVEPTGLPVRHTILLLGRSGRPMERMLQYLREHGLYVVGCLSADSAQEALSSPQYQFAAVLGLCDRDSEWIWSFLGTQRQLRSPLKAAVQILGHNVDELNTQFMTGADMIFSPDTSELELLTRLQSLLPAAEPPTP